MVAKVLVELTNRNVDKTFDYLIPSHLSEFVKVGIRVLVPFGYQKLEGFVLNITQETTFSDLKEILEVVDQEVVLNQELLELGIFLQNKTLSTLIRCYQVMLPKALKAKNGSVVPIRYESVISLGNTPFELEKLNEKQRMIVQEILNSSYVFKNKLTKISASSVSTLLKKGILKEEKKEKYRLDQTSNVVSKHPLTNEQEKIVDTVLLKKDEYVPYLLYGVTGSGKTEVYMVIIEEQLKNNKTAIVLVPEISLTPQIVSRFRGRFGEKIAVLHSRLSDGERYDEWRKIVRKEVSVVIGARSAVFAPLENLGIIIIDEEHTSSYHQENNPRYHAIDVAMWRGQRHHCPVILSSATPTLESFARAKKGVYQLLELPHRVNERPLPKIKIVDLNQTHKKEHFYFSKELLDSIQLRLEKKEQVLLLLNRRGYSSYITCSNCGYVEKCPNCDITLTYHKSSNMLRCHYCGYATKKNLTCSNCHHESMKDLGVGTEKIEEQLQLLCPSARIIRMDVDTTSRKGAHEKIIEDFGNFKYDILLGTQMIAKGLDFPNVTLVGVINADTSLNIPDFRSSEVTFQLLDQVAGRSGRGEKTGEVIIQTYNPDHYAIQYAKNHDYFGFYLEEMKIRQQLKYSPYFYMTLVKISSSDYEFARTESQKIANYLKKELIHSILLGPTISGMFKINNIYHFQIIIKYKREECLYSSLKKILEIYQDPKKIKIDIDFQPTSFI